MRQKVLSLRGRDPGTENVVIDILLEEDHWFGWKGWLLEDRMSPKKNGICYLWMACDWVPFAYVESEVS
jgi:hypothetical protein